MKEYVEQSAHGVTATEGEPMSQAGRRPIIALPSSRCASYRAAMPKQRRKRGGSC